MVVAQRERGDINWEWAQEVWVTEMFCILILLEAYIAIYICKSFIELCTLNVFILFYMFYFKEY